MSSNYPYFKDFLPCVLYDFILNYSREVTNDFLLDFLFESVE